MKKGRPHWTARAKVSSSCVRALANSTTCTMRGVPPSTAVAHQKVVGGGGGGGRGGVSLAWRRLGRGLTHARGYTSTGSLLLLPRPPVQRATSLDLAKKHKPSFGCFWLVGWNRYPGGLFRLLKGQGRRRPCSLVAAVLWTCPHQPLSNISDILENVGNFLVSLKLEIIIFFLFSKS